MCVRERFWLEGGEGGAHVVEFVAVFRAVFVDDASAVALVAVGRLALSSSVRYRIRKLKITAHQSCQYKHEIRAYIQYQDAPTKHSPKVAPFPTEIVLHLLLHRQVEETLLHLEQPIRILQ